MALNLLKKPLFWVILMGMAIALGYFLTMLKAAEMRAVAPLDDAYIHFQYAKQIALGQPWQYNSGYPISTGATSLIYPFLLAVAYWLGFREDGIVWPAMLIGATSLVISAVLIYKITFNLNRSEERLPALWQRRIALITSLLFLFTGAIPWSYLNGMETGLFTLFILAAFHSFVTERPGRTALFLTLSALARPEGIFLAGIAWLISAGQLITDRQQYKRQFGLMTIAMLLSSTPYLVNIVLTGTPVATGAQAKSWLGNVPFVLSDLLISMGRMAVLILERMTFGFLASRSWPVVPGVLLLAMVGAISLWKRKYRWTVLLAGGWFIAGTLLAATLITALWQIGRYQVPFLAILVPFVGVGFGVLLISVRPRWRKGLAFGFLLWAVLVIISSAEAVRAYYDAVASTYGQQIALADTISRQLPDDSLVAVHDAGAIKYLGNRNIYDMIGLTTQGTADAWRHGSGAIFELMMEASHRPTHFATYPDVATIPYFAETSLFGRQLFVTEPYGSRTANSAGPVQALYETEWEPAENKDQPQQSDIRALLTDMVQVASIDLADLIDEEKKNMSWTIGRTQPGFPTEVRQFTFRADSQHELLDGGRLISGQMAFPVSASPNEDLTLVARLHPHEAGAMAVKVNGRDAGLWRYPAAPGHWLETTYSINRDLIDDDLLEIELQYVDEEGTALPIGVYHMWAYQGPRQKSMVEPQVTLEYNLEPQIVLQGYDLATNEVQRSENLKLTLYWYAENTPDIDAKVFLHLYNAQGDLVGQIDQRPFHDTRPPYTWFPGEQIVDTYQLQISPDLQPGQYDLAIGMYDPSSNERFVVTTSKGENLPNSRIFLDKILIIDE